MNLKEYENRLRKCIDIQNIFLESINDQQFQDWLLAIITNRLYYDGVGADNRILKTDSAYRNIDKGKKTTYKGIERRYAPATNRIKRKKGQPFDRVTLRDTTEFYRSFKIKTSKNFIKIEAQFSKKNSNIYDNFRLTYKKDEFIKNILGLNIAERQWLKDKLKERFIKIIKRIMQNGQ